MAKSYKYDWNKEQIEIAVKNNYCYADVLRELNIPVAGRNSDTLKRKIKEFDISTQHFTFQAKSKYKEKVAIENYLTTNSHIKSYFLKQRLLKAKLKENKCEICGLSEWRGQPLAIQLHHINGDNTDNRIENLQMLCPNCHSQTESYCGSSKPQHYCQCCGRELKTNAVYCISCAKKEENKQKWIQRLNSNPNLSNIEIAKLYNVTEAAVRKWKKKLIK